MWGSLISAGASLLGGLLGSKSQKDANQANIDAANARNAAEAAERERDRALQREFAQQGIRWKVADAEAAGIHPLYALGAPTVSYNPASIGGTTPQIGADMSMANAVSTMGQDISRAVDAKRTGPERIDAFKKTVQDLTLQKMGLENQLLGAQIAKLRQSPPPMPGGTYMLPGQGNAPISVTSAQQWPTAKQNVQLGPVWEANPHVSNAKDVEDRYGEGVSDWLWPLLTVPSDIYWNTAQHFRRKPLATGRFKFKPRGAWYN